MPKIVSLLEVKREPDPFFVAHTNFQPAPPKNLGRLSCIIVLEDGRKFKIDIHGSGEMATGGIKTMQRLFDERPHCFTPVP